VTSARLPTAGEARYRETLRAPLSWWLGGLAFCGVVWWAIFVATSSTPALVGAVVAAGVVVPLLVRYGGVRVEVNSHGFRVGRASLPWRYVGAATPCDASRTRELLGPGADARAYLVVRPYIKGAVQVAVVDERDPAPYWLISTRHPGVVAAALAPRDMPN
jgi:Protein of unknown function (DUF3093)